MKKIFNKRKNSHFSKGISLIALIVTIIVIIILAAIVIFSGLNTPDRANLAKFVQNISDFRLAVQNDFMSKKAEYATNGVSRSDAQIYYIIANGGGEGVISNINEEPNDTSGQYPNTYSLTSLGLDNSGIEGKYAFYIADDTYVKNWTKHTTYYEPGETHWITDKGDVFIMKGYRVEEDGNENYYLNEKVKVNTALTNPEVVETIEMKNVEVGDYIYYDPDSTNTYTTTVEYAGVANSLMPSTITNKVWRVWNISGGKITIVPNENHTNAELYLSDVQGYVNGAKIVNDACKALFTNSTLGVTSSDIRSMTIEDINAVYDGTDKEEGGVPFYNGDGTNRLKYLFYQGTSATPSTEKASEGYSEKPHSTSTSYSSNTGYRKFFFPKDINGNTISGFADMEGGTSGTTDGGMRYLAISAGNPIYVKNTLRYKTSPTWKTIGGTGKNGTENYGGMLPYSSWLASPTVALGSSSEYAYLGLQFVRSSLVYGRSLYFTMGYMYSRNFALRPLVSLSSTLKYVSGDGTSSTTAWQVTR